MALPWTLLIIVLFSISATAMVANATLLSGGILGGVIACTYTSVSVAETYKVIPLSKVDLFCGASCASMLVVVAQTNTAGFYTFLFMSAGTILPDGGKSYLNVTIPPNSCVFNIPTGVLRIPLLVLSKVKALVGKFLVLAPGALSYVLCK